MTNRTVYRRKIVNERRSVAEGLRSHLSYSVADLETTILFYFILSKLYIGQTDQIHKASGCYKSSASNSINSLWPSFYGALRKVCNGFEVTCHNHKTLRFVKIDTV